MSRRLYCLNEYFIFNLVYNNLLLNTLFSKYNLSHENNLAANSYVKIKATIRFPGF